MYIHIYSMYCICISSLVLSLWNIRQFGAFVVSSGQKIIWNTKCVAPSSGEYRMYCFQLPEVHTSSSLFLLLVKKLLKSHRWSRGPGKGETTCLYIIWNYFSWRWAVLTHISSETWYFRFLWHFPGGSPYIIKTQVTRTRPSLQTSVP